VCVSDMGGSDRLSMGRRAHLPRCFVCFAHVSPLLSHQLAELAGWDGRVLRLQLKEGSKGRGGKG
jgi:hypothetical protein